MEQGNIALAALVQQLRLQVADHEANGNGDRICVSAPSSGDGFDMSTAQNISLSLMPLHHCSSCGKFGHANQRHSIYMRKSRE
jgi:hypothetical protein